MNWAGLSRRLSDIDWTKANAALNLRGAAILPGLLEPGECEEIVALYDVAERFRSRVIMQRHGYGKGEYRYFSYPLPDPVQQLRETLYPPLADIANRWQAMLGQTTTYPANHAAFIARCHAAEQTRPTPLLLRYGTGDYNCLHQDIYGELLFPLQVVFLLADPATDFTGGELLLTEQRMRMQSRPLVLPLRQGDAAVFAVSTRPVQGSRGAYRVNMRHGVSEVRDGRRHSLGIIFHDAR
jgi:hypothetical protein